MSLSVICLQTVDRNFEDPGQTQTGDFFFPEQMLSGGNKK